MEILSLDDGDDTLRIVIKNGDRINMDDPVVCRTVQTVLAAAFAYLEPGVRRGLAEDFDDIPPREADTDGTGDKHSQQDMEDDRVAFRFEYFRTDPAPAAVTALEAPPPLDVQRDVA